MTITYRACPQEDVDFYSAPREDPPGIWYASPDSSGQRNTNFGFTYSRFFSGDDPKRFERLAAGIHPDTQERLVQDSGHLKRVALHVLIPSVPKTVSLVWALAQRDLQVRIEKASFVAGRGLLDFLAEHAFGGPGAKALLRGAMFNHYVDRLNNPHLRTHCVLFTVAETEDGVTHRLEAGEMMRWLEAAQAMYLADLAYKLREIGFGISKKGDAFEIAGIPDKVTQEFFLV